MKRNTDIRKFGIRLILFIIPFIILISSFVIIDPFKIIKDYDHYNGGFVELNADVVSTKMYLKNRSRYHYDSFIFGNSRCLAYKTYEWKKYLGKKDVPFVFMAFNESLYGLVTKIRFMDTHNNDTIKNALLVLDDMVLSQTKNYSDFHLFIKQPKITGDSWLQFYTCFFKAYLSDYFFIKCIDYSIFHKEREYMKTTLNGTGHYFDPVTNDLYLMREINAIRSDSAEFYKKFRSKFKFGKNGSGTEKKTIYKTQEMMLLEIKQIFDKHKTNYKIIINPKISRLPMHPEDKEKLIKIFGKETIYDFSGLNRYTSDIHNYYDPFHHTIETGTRILNEVYAPSLKE